MTNSQRQEDRAIRLAAHEWRLTLAEAEATREEREQFQAWIDADIRHEAAFDRAETLYQAFDVVDAETLGPEVMQRSWRERWPKIRFPNLNGQLLGLRRVGAVAATLMVIGLAIALLVPNQNASAPAVVDVVNYRTTVGEIATVTLADGSTVTLGAKSALSVAFDDQQRRVTLADGAALFDVVPDPDRPFKVRAGALAATAVGTSFDVRHSGGVARVAVASGEVAVTHPLVIAGRLAGPLEQASLTKGQQIAATAVEGLSPVTEIAPASVAAWQQKRLIYAGAPLAELLADARRYSGRTIIFQDDAGALAAAKVTAFFDGNDIQGMLDTLPNILPVAVRETASGTMVIEALP